MADPVTVLIVDDSSIVRRTLESQLNGTPGVRVVGAAPDPFVGRDLILSLDPDVVILDVEMPRMDGLTFLRKLMKHQPRPVIMFTSLGEAGGKVAMEALEAGAVDVVCKPHGSYSVGKLGPVLARKVRAAASAGKRGAAVALRQPAAAPRPLAVPRSNKLIAIGASTGGTEAIRSVLRSLSADCPPILMAQHMPKEFTGQFARSLDSCSDMHVKEAEDGDRVEAGVALLAPGDLHMSYHNGVVRLRKGPRVHHQRPAVDVLFESVAEGCGRHAVGVLLTGMGQDGARGLLAMREKGARTIAQDEASCVVYGMPRVAAELGAAEVVCSLDDVPARIVAACAARAA